MALFQGIQEYIVLDANNITLVFDSGNIVNISGNIFLYPPQGHPILYKSLQATQQLFHPISGQCMDCDPERHEIFMSKCRDIDSQKWKFAKMNESIIRKDWDA